jgi:peptidyl-tRNA hydrolase
MFLSSLSLLTQVNIEEKLKNSPDGKYQNTRHNIGFIIL